jgi:iron complex transport system permease protein
VTHRLHPGAAVVGSLILVGIAVVLGISYGSSGGDLSIGLGFLTGTLDPSTYEIVTFARLPRVIFGLVVGAALACSGAVFQAVLRNPLADPYILGVSGGAALGGSLFVALGGASLGLMGALGLPGASFVGALAAIALILAVGRWGPDGRTGTYVLLLTGVVANAFASSCITFMKAVISAIKAQELLFYLMGSLAIEGVGATETAVVAGVTVLCLVIVYAFARDLNVLSLGDDEASSLGVEPERVRAITVLVSSFAVALAVAYTGLIGFVGLVVPHGVRLLVGPDHRVLLPVCALGGAAFLVLSDVAARSAFGLMNTAIPVGVMTAFIGAPLFIVFLRRHLREAA